MNVWILFILLQIADILSTQVGLWLGSQEINPAGILMMSKFNPPILGIIVSKMLGISFIFGGCRIFKKNISNLIGRVNTIFGWLIIWNICAIGAQLSWH